MSVVLPDNHLGGRGHRRKVSGPWVGCPLPEHSAGAARLPISVASLNQHSPLDWGSLGVGTQSS